MTPWPVIHKKGMFMIIIKFKCIDDGFMKLI